ncbi:MAG: shikimate dehydrogenase, partial [Deltaproteobacteria bacterium]|nr:shikimate dehydrogenase [Deltaproteobacteria bacterium]
KYAIIGNPVQHSLSPFMQEAAFQKRNIEASYQKILVKPENFSDFFKTLPQRKLSGFNVTVPYKEQVIPFLDEISDEVKAIGACNTILVENHRLKGFNTDAWGYLKSLVQETKFNPVHKRILILGAGGAARAVAYALSQASVKEIIILNRTLPRAELLTQQLRPFSKKIKWTTLVLNEKYLNLKSPQADLIINTTSASLYGENLPHFPWNKLKSTVLFSDIVYKPKLTSFLKAAKAHHHRIHYGLGMLLYQGCRAFEIWTQQKAPIIVMKQALTKALRASQK